MVFWNWAKGLEDAFDSRNRRQLHDFIVGKDDTAYDGKVRHDIVDDEAIVEHEVETEESDTATLYCLPTDAPNGDEKNVEGRRELGRVPLFAIFHRMANEKGVPHSFTRMSAPLLVKGFMTEYIRFHLAMARTADLRRLPYRASSSGCACHDRRSLRSEQTLRFARVLRRHLLSRLS